MLGQRLRRWPSINPTLGQLTVLDPVTFSVDTVAGLSPVCRCVRSTLCSLRCGIKVYPVSFCGGTALDLPCAILLEFSSTLSLSIGVLGPSCKLLYIGVLGPPCNYLSGY